MGPASSELGDLPQVLPIGMKFVSMLGVGGCVPPLSTSLEQIYWPLPALDGSVALVPQSGGREKTSENPACWKTYPNH